MSGIGSILGNQPQITSLIQAIGQQQPAATGTSAITQQSAGQKPASGRQPPNPGDVVNYHKFVGGNPSDPAAWEPLKGDDFLHELGKTDPTMAIRVKAISDGREPLPSTSRINPFNRMLTNAVAQYDPEGYDSINNKTRLKLREDMTSGASAQNIRNINQAVGHLQTMMNSMPGVEGTSNLGPLSVPFNAVVNKYDEMSGHPGITSYQTSQTGLAGELASLFKGRGSSSEQEVNKWFSQLSENHSDAQKYAAARTLTEMLKSRLDELHQQYQQGMGTSAQPFQTLNPLAADAYKRLSTIGQKLSGDNGDQSDPTQGGTSGAPQVPAGWSIQKVP